MVARRRHVGGRRPPPRPDAVRRLLLRAAEVVRLPRAACGSRSCSPAAIDRIERIAASGRWCPPSLDLTVALENSRLDQTYNTPALATLFLLDDTIEWMLDQGGLEWAASRVDRSAETLYGWAEASPVATPFVAKPSERSHVTGTIDFDGVDGPRSLPRCARTGSSTRSRTASSGATSSGSRCSPPSSPTTSRCSPSAIDFLVDASANSAVGGLHAAAARGAPRPGRARGRVREVLPRRLAARARRRATTRRLLYFMHLTHGSGRAYTVVTVTAVRDGAAYERLAARIQDGDLQRVGRATSTSTVTTSRARSCSPCRGRRRSSTSTPSRRRNHEPRAHAVHGGHGVAARGHAPRVPRGRGALRAEHRREAAGAGSSSCCRCSNPRGAPARTRRSCSGSGSPTTTGSRTCC